MDLIVARSVNFSSVPPTFTTTKGTVHPLLLPEIVYEDENHLIISAFVPR